MTQSTFQQRLALGILLSAITWWLIPVERHRILSVLAGTGVLLVCLIALVFTLSIASRQQETAIGERTTRAGFRVLALNASETALPIFEKVMTIDPSNRAARAEVARLRLNLAESEVADGLSAEAYERAAGHLALALNADPTETAQTLSDAIAAVRHADIVWNQYDWPVTVSELRRAYRLRPDLSGIGGKLYAAEISAALAAIEARDLRSAQRYLDEAAILLPDGRDLIDLRARLAASNRS